MQKEVGSGMQIVQAGGISKLTGMIIRQSCKANEQKAQKRQRKTPQNRQRYQAKGGRINHFERASLTCCLIIVAAK